MLDPGTGLSHLNTPIQNALERGLVPPGFESPGMDAHASRFLLSQELQGDVASHGQLLVSVVLTDA